VVEGNERVTAVRLKDEDAKEKLEFMLID